MLSSLSIRFYLNEYKPKGNRLPIYLRITVDRKKAEIATQYSLEPKEWNPNTQRTKKNSVINAQLNSAENQVYEIVGRLEKENKTVSANEIKKYLVRREKLDPIVLEYFDETIERLENAGEVKSSTISRYKDTKAHLTSFLAKKKISSLLLKNLHYKLIDDFDLYLISKKGQNGGNLERNTVNKHHSRLKTVLLRGIREGYLEVNPYANFKFRNTPSRRTFLSQEELNLLIKHDLGENQSLIRVRDIFIFSVYTGLRFEDGQGLTMDSIHIDKKGNYSISLKQEKTAESLSIPLLRPAVSIIEKYHDSPERLIFKKVLPKISNQKVNAYLKVIADLTGIKKELTHHVARHTCATTVLLSNEVPIEIVSKWLGHTDIKTTQIYAKITHNYLLETAKKVDAKL